jgi:CDP-paratose 2-epimerase
MKCAATGTPYTVFGYGGKQVRDNIHSADLIRAFDQFFNNPKSGAVYNMGGGRFSNCSMLEAIKICEDVCGREMEWNYSEQTRKGDHIWWISDVSAFSRDYPSWRLTHDVPSICAEIFDANAEHWLELAVR